MPPIQKEMDRCRAEYVKQRKLERFVNQRGLHKPKTKKWQVALLTLLTPFLLLCAVLFSFHLQICGIYKWITLVISLFFIFEWHIRFCLIQTVKCYQHYAKEKTRRRCMCVPSCSEYAILCLKKIFPLFIALIKIRRRLYKTCKGGDYRLDFPFQKMNLAFERRHFD